MFHHAFLTSIDFLDNINPFLFKTTDWTISVLSKKKLISKALSIMLNCGGYFIYRRRQSSASETSFEIKIGRRLLSKHSVVLLIYHCYELLYALFIHCYLLQNTRYTRIKSQNKTFVRNNL
jgi:hypothetical protein